MAGMEGDPKDPNAWWAVKLSLVSMWPKNPSKDQKKRLYWLLPLLIAIASAEIFGLYKMGLFSN